MLIFVFFSIAFSVHQAELDSSRVVPDADPGCTNGLAFIGNDLLILRHTVPKENEVGDVSRINTASAQQLAGAVVTNGSALVVMGRDEVLVFVDNAADSAKRVMRVTGLDKPRFDVAPDAKRTLDAKLNTVTGAAHNGTHMFAVDGSNIIHVLDPHTLLQINSFRCTYDDKPVGMLTELEWVRGRLWANHGVENEILIINPDTGVVVAFVNVKRFNQAPEPGCCFCGVPIARGIAYSQQLDILYLTGRYWPYVYQIKVTYMEQNGELVVVGAGSHTNVVGSASDGLSTTEAESKTSILTYVVVASILVSIGVLLWIYHNRAQQQQQIKL
jgi:glutamine cyclotransferase